MKVGSGAGHAGGEKKIHPKPKLALDTAFKKERSGLQTYVEQYGKGHKAKKGDTIVVHYEGFLAEDNKMFDSSLKKKKPFTFELGKGAVIEGWDKAMIDAKKGTKLQLKIPADMAYGLRGVKSLGIPANADLVFKVTVISVEPAEQASDKRRYI